MGTVFQIEELILSREFCASEYHILIVILACYLKKPTFMFKLHTEWGLLIIYPYFWYPFFVTLK